MFRELVLWCETLDEKISRADIGIVEKSDLVVIKYLDKTVKVLKSRETDLENGKTYSLVEYNDIIRKIVEGEIENRKMKNYFVNYNFQIVDMIRASNFYRDHKETVDEMISTESNSIYPSMLDIGFPKEWEPMHWKWFLKLNGHIIFSGDV